MKFKDLDDLVAYTTWHDDDGRALVVAHRKRPVPAFTIWDTADTTVVDNWTENTGKDEPLLEVVLGSDFTDVVYCDQEEYPIDTPQPASLTQRLARAINKIVKIEPDEVPPEAVNNALNTVWLLGILLEAIEVGDWQVLERD